MRSVLYCDIQTFSAADIKKFSGQYYAEHESTRVLFMTYAFDLEGIHQWEPSETDTFLGTYASIPDDLREYLRCGAGLVCLWYPSFTTPIMRSTLGLEVHSPKVRSLSGMSKGQGWPTRFMDFYTKVNRNGKYVRAHSFAPYSGEEVDISYPIQLFSVEGADPQENKPEWEWFKKACRKRVWAYREIHRNILTGDFLKTGQALLDTVI